jgi:hypothetical protein
LFKAERGGVLCNQHGCRLAAVSSCWQLSRQKKPSQYWLRRFCRCPFHHHLHLHSSRLLLHTPNDRYDGRALRTLDTRLALSTMPALICVATHTLSTATGRSDPNNQLHSQHRAALKQSARSTSSSVCQCMGRTWGGMPEQRGTLRTVRPPPTADLNPCTIARRLCRVSAAWFR